MTSCYHRLTAGQTLPDIPVQPPKIKPTASNIPLIPPRPCINQRPVRIVLRLRKCWRVEAVGPVGRSEGGDGAKKAGPGAGPGPAPCSYSVGNQRVGDRTVETGRRERKRAVEVVVAAGVTVVLGVGNRVLYKLALVPLKHYPFFLAQLATFGYVLVYFSILHLRYHAGIVTDEMLSMPKAPFLAVGLLEALAAATGMAAGAILSGASIPILSQTFLVWQILLSIIFLGRRYRINQLVGCFLVAVGVIITVASGSGTGFSLKEAGIFWSLLMIVSFLLQAADTVLKELPNYLKDGAACFLNISGTISSGCDGAPLLPLLFVIVNMGFNVSLLHLLKISSAVVSSLASTFSVPISVYVFTLPLPYLGVASSLPTGFVAGAIILVLGLLVYAWSPSGSTSALA
ncbi:protein CLT1, chloroplastic isoform X2 [Herrania umbratica]|uniref:Protein CLT1, chloroplastic isoform X2 n=1 Tax=Herrania umbratica TaxID=108875 RepID=A0A6J0ZWH7_9ROSI|nr:protein CLT1, chloroplastic isoform X2 [Herrania umbratica]